MNEYGYVTADPAYVLTQPDREKGLGGYRFLAVVFFLLAVGGLFIGMLGTVLPAFLHRADAFDDLFFAAGKTNAFDYSVCGAILALFKNFGVAFSSIGEAFATFLSGGIWLLLDLIFLLFVAFSAVLSLVLMLVSFFVKKSKTACRAAFTGGVVSLVSYGGMFLVRYCMSFAAAGLGEAIDVPLILVSGAILLFLAIGTFARSKGHGALNVFLLLLTAVAACAVAYPATLLSVCNFNAFNLSAQSPFVGIAFPVLFIVLALNLVLSCVRLNATKSYVFDIVRYGLLFFAVLLAVVALIAAPVEAGNNFAVFQSPNLLPTVVLLVATLIPLLSSIFATAIGNVKRRNLEQQNQALQNAIGPEQNAYDQPATNVVVTVDSSLLGGKKNDQNAESDAAPLNLTTPDSEPGESLASEPVEPIVTTSIPEPVVIKEVVREFVKEEHDEAPLPPPAVEYKPAEPTKEEVAETEKPKEQDTKELEEKFKRELEDFKRDMELKRLREAEEKRLKEEEERRRREEEEQRKKESERPAITPEDRRAKDREEYLRQRKELSEFEQRMAALARGEAAANKQGGADDKRKAVSDYPAEPVGRKRPSLPTGGGYALNGMQYTYDPFINTLTTSEKNEFGDVFIANLYGIHSYLPTYVIGGDNREFFQKVFIYLGRYRGYITQELMEKIYAYVNKTS